MDGLLEQRPLFLLCPCFRSSRRIGSSLRRCHRQQQGWNTVSVPKGALRSSPRRASALGGGRRARACAGGGRRWGRRSGGRRAGVCRRQRARLERLRDRDTGEQPAAASADMRPCGRDRGRVKMLGSWALGRLMGLSFSSIKSI